jgi:hypothetical protein
MAPIPLGIPRREDDIDEGKSAVNTEQRACATASVVVNRAMIGEIGETRAQNQ